MSTRFATFAGCSWLLVPFIVSCDRTAVCDVATPAELDDALAGDCETISAARWSSAELEASVADGRLVSLHVSSDTIQRVAVSGFSAVTSTTPSLRELDASQVGHVQIDQGSGLEILRVALVPSAGSMPERIFLLSVHDAPTIATVDVTADGFVEDVRLSMFFIDANLRDAALTIGSGATPTFQLVTDALVAIDQLRALGSRMKTTAVVGSAESVGEYADWLRAEDYAGELLACPSETIGEACSQILP